MTIEGDLADFAHLETIYLGFLARQSRIATNVRRVVKAANGKPVLFFPARYDTYQTQESDGYAAMVGGIKGFSTDANALASSGKGLGTIPHALIAAYNGDTLAATCAFDKYVAPDIARIALVDFDNDCVGTTCRWHVSWAASWQAYVLILPAPWSIKACYRKWVCLNLPASARSWFIMFAGR